MLTTHCLPDDARALLYDERRSIPTTEAQYADAAATAQGIWTLSLEKYAINCRGVAHYLAYRGRANESAFWRKMDAAVAENLAEVANGSNARTRAGILNDLLKARLFDLKCAVDADNNLPTAKADTTGNQWTRQMMSRGV